MRECQGEQEVRRVLQRDPGVRVSNALRFLRRHGAPRAAPPAAAPEPTRDAEEQRQGQEAFSTLRAG